MAAPNVSSERCCQAKEAAPNVSSERCCQAKEAAPNVSHFALDADIE